MAAILIVLGLMTAMAVGMLLATYCVAVDRSLIARAELKAQQRRAEAELQHTAQDTIRRMFEAARRQP